MKKEIHSNLFIKNRKKFIKKISYNSIALFYSYDFYSFCDEHNIHKNNANLFYVCGLNNKETIVLLFPNAKEKKFKEIIFIRKITEKIKICEGEYFSKEKVSCITGIKNVCWIDDFSFIFFNLSHQVKYIYLNLDQKYFKNYKFFINNLHQYIKYIQNIFSFYFCRSSNKILERLRLIKEFEELEFIKKAVSITEKGFKRISSYIKPGIWEFEIEAELIHEFIKNGSDGFAYNPIIASGSNTNILHYNLNNQQCKSQDIILVDVGAKYANYSSDFTRVFPINKTFSKRQKQVYQAVLNIKKYAENLLISGNSFQYYNIEVGKKVTKELLKIKLLNSNKIYYQNNIIYKKFFVHEISHHLGLNTHDYDGVFFDKFQKNMVITIEPGIYIPNENIGIRLEDTYVVQSIGNPINLTKNFPIEYKDIEFLMIK